MGLKPHVLASIGIILDTVCVMTVLCYTEILQDCD